MAKSTKGRQTMRIKISRYENGKFTTIFDHQVLIFNISRKSEHYMMIEYRYYGKHKEVLSAYYDFHIDDDIIYVSSH